VLAGSSGIGQIAALAAAPILTRLYTPSDFGLLAIYMSLTIVVGVIVCLRYELAIALPESDREALNTTALAFSLAIVMSLLGIVVVWFAREQIAALFNVPALAKFLWFFPLTMLLFGAFTAASYWAMRTKSFGALAKARLMQVLSSLAVQLGGATFGPVALIGGQLANQGVGSVSLTKRVLRHPDIRHVTWSGMRQSAFRYRHFPLLSSWSALLNRGSAQLPALMFAALFGPIPAGLYALAMRVVNGPAVVLTTAIQQVFLSAAAGARRDGGLGGLTVSTHARLAALCMPPLMLMSVIAPELFGFVFGEQWSGAGDFAKWLAIIVYFGLTVSPLMHLFAVLERQGHELFFQLMLFTLRIGLIGAGWYLGSPEISIACYSVGSLLYYGAFMRWASFQLDVRLSAFLWPILKSACVSAAMCLPIWLALYLNVELKFQVLGLVVSSVVVAVHVLRNIRRVYR